MKNELFGQEHLDSFDRLMGGSMNNGDIVELPVEKLKTFSNHPFRVEDDEEMELLVESVKEKGIINPILVRKVSDDEYEIISGHRRKRACELAKIKTIPAIVKELNDSEAIIFMVDSNLYREKTLPSEKANAYRMRKEAGENHQGFRSDLTSRHDVGKLQQSESEKTNRISERQIQRYIRLSYLNNDLLKMVDNDQIPMTAAVELSYIGDEEQTWIYSTLCSEKKALTPKKAKALRKAYKEGKLDAMKTCLLILGERTENVGRVCFSYSELKVFFTDIDMRDSRSIKESIIDILRQNRKEKVET